MSADKAEVEIFFFKSAAYFCFYSATVCYNAARLEKRFMLFYKRNNRIRIEIYKGDIRLGNKLGKLADFINGAVLKRLFGNGLCSSPLHNDLCFS